MNRKIEILKEVISRSQTMSEVISTEVLYTPWAYMQELSGGETEEGKIIHLVNRTYVIRYNRQILKEATKLLVKDTEIVYQILHAKEINKTHVELICRLYE